MIIIGQIRINNKCNNRCNNRCNRRNKCKTKVKVDIYKSKLSLYHSIANTSAVSKGIS